jgi:hypothetical protein
MRYRASVVGLKRSQDAEGGGDNVNEAIDSADKKVGGAGANACEVALEKSVRCSSGWTRGRSSPYIED